MDIKNNKALKIILASAILIFIIYIIVLYWPNTTCNEHEATKKIVTDTLGNNGIIKFVGSILGFIVGDVPTCLWENSSSGASGPMSALIVIIALWAFLVLAMGDIFNNFSSFSKGVSGGMAIALGVAAANLGLISRWTVAITQMFLFLGAFAIYGGLLASFLVFFLVEWGFGGGISDWIFRRKMMQAAAKEEVKTLVGAKKVASFIKGAKEGADAFAE